MKTVQTGSNVFLASHAQSVPAFGVTVDDTGGFFGGPGGLTLEDVLALIGAGTAPGAFLTVVGGGKGTVQAHGTLGATETIDLALGNLHWGTLGDNTAISTTGWTNGKDCQITLALIEDGTGGWTPTLTGVTWIGGAPTWDTTLGTITIVALFSWDGGTTIYGGVLGAGGGSSTGGMVPYYIPAATVWTNPLYFQALASVPIEVDGALVNNGVLVIGVT